MFEAAFANLASVCEQTRAELASYRRQRPGDTDEAFLEQSVKQYVRAGREAPNPAVGNRMQALSVYALVVKCDEVTRLKCRVAHLEDALSMRDDALSIAWDLVDKLETSSGAEHSE